MTKDTCFDGQTAVITGAGGTLCSEIARGLARRGAKVALLGRTLSTLEKVASGIADEGGTALPVVADVTDEAAVERARQTVTATLGPCRFLLNGAGGNHVLAMTTISAFDERELAETGPDEVRGFFNLELDMFESIVRANTLGTVTPSRIFGREMAALKRGAILNFASMNSYRPLTRVPAYAMAKAGVVSFTQWLAVYLAPAGIRVNAVAPGFFVNERSRKYLMTPEGGLSPRGEKVMSHTPVGRFGEAGDLMGCVCWLLNDEQASFVTGVTVPVDGGFLAASGV